MVSKNHWENVYSTKAPEEVSWFQEHAQHSLKAIRDSGTGQSGPIIDVGGGASTLVDDLLNNGYENVTILDLSGAALAASRNRLGAQANNVTWIEANVLEAELPINEYDIWHDRAVFHFLTAEEDRQAYVKKVKASLKPNGFVIIATFAEDGPVQCSGFPVMRYSPTHLLDEFGETFHLIRHTRESHHTPAGREQRFIYCSFRYFGEK